MRTIKLTDKMTLEIMPTPEEVAEFFSPDINPLEKRKVKNYQSKDIQKKAKISAIQIGHWTKTGVIIPAQAVRGTGKMHVYDHQNLIEAMICRELSQYSISYGVMQEVMEFLRNRKWNLNIQIGSFENKRFEERSISVWELFKQYPQDNDIFFLLWKNSQFLELPEPKTGEFAMHITSLDLFDIVMRCPSAIILNLTDLFRAAGSFYEP